MILLEVKLSRLDASSTQLKQAFNFPFKFIYGQPVTGQEAVFEKCIKSGERKFACGPPRKRRFYLFQINFHSEASCFVIFKYKCTMTQGTFQSGL